MPDFLYVFRKIELLQVVDELGKSVAVKVAFGFSKEVMGLNASVNCVIRAVGDHTEMMGLIGAGNNPMVGMTVAVAVAIEEACK